MNDQGANEPPGADKPSPPWIAHGERVPVPPEGAAAQFSAASFAHGADHVTVTDNYGERVLTATASRGTSPQRAATAMPHTKPHEVPAAIQSRPASKSHRHGDENMAEADMQIDGKGHGNDDEGRAAKRQLGDDGSESDDDVLIRKSKSKKKMRVADDDKDDDADAGEDDDEDAGEEEEEEGDEAEEEVDDEEEDDDEEEEEEEEELDEAQRRDVISGLAPGSPTNSASTGDTTNAVPPAIIPFDWSDTTPAAAVSLDVPVPRRTWCWLQNWTLNDVQAMRPCDTKWKKEDQKQLLADIKAVLKLPHRFVIVAVECRPSANGFPGRLYSKLAGLCGPIRANLLEESADIDMSMAQLRIVRWVCNHCPSQQMPTPMLDYLIANRDGDNGMIRRLMDETGCSKGKAKSEYIAAFNSGKPRNHIKSDFYKKVDTEAKEIQRFLMARPELQWILQYCKDGDGGIAGSFMAHLFHWVECKLLAAVSGVISAEFSVAIAALVFDGFNIADASLHGNQAVLDRAHSVCEQVCPGVNMLWAWKPLDFGVKSVDKLVPITNADGSLREVRVPADFVAPAMGSAEAAELEDEAALGPKEFTFEQMRQSFSLGLNGQYGKVGSTYIKVEEDGTVTCLDERRMKSHHKHLKYWSMKETTDRATGLTKKEKSKSDFIEQWMKDERMDPKYLPDEKKHERYFWERFDMYPDASECPSDVYNLWSGLAAEDMTTDLNDETVRDGLLRILKHFKMMCSGDAAQYNFLLDLVAHMVQFPAVKVGIVICLVGKQGCGKGTCWDILERMLGPGAWFSTKKPERDVVGNFNSAMKYAFFVRMAECNKAKFEHVIGELRGTFTDGKIDVHEKFCNVVNVKSYARFGIDTNFVDAIPDEHGERRYFIIKCNEEMIGHHDYFTKLQNEVIADDRVIRAFYDFLKERKIKPTYQGKDIPVGAYQRALKNSNRGEAEGFLEWLTEEEDMGVKKLHLPNTAPPSLGDSEARQPLAVRYKAFRGEGAHDRSTDSIMKQLSLGGIEGVATERARPQNLEWCPSTLVGGPPQCSFCQNGIPTAANKVMRRTTIDLEVMRVRFSIEDEAPVSTEPEDEAPAEVDCEAEVQAFCEQQATGERR